MVQTSPKCSAFPYFTSQEIIVYYYYYYNILGLLE